MWITLECSVNNDQVSRLWTREVELAGVPQKGNVVEVMHEGEVSIIVNIYDTVFRSSPGQPRVRCRGSGFLLKGKATRGTMQKLGWTWRKWY